MIENFNIKLSQIPELKLSPFERLKLLTEKGVYKLGDLVRLSGVPCSIFLGMELNKSISKDVSNIPSIPIGTFELHFYEILGGLYKSNVVKNIVFVNTSEDFIKTITQDFNLNVQKSFKSKGISSIDRYDGLNFDEQVIVLEPEIGGYVDVKKGYNLEDLSVKQLNLLYKGIVERNPNNYFLSEIVYLLKKKIR